MISRQAAIEEIEPYTDNNYNSTAIEIKEILQRLPSVQPKRKTGRWIYMKTAKIGSAQIAKIFLCCLKVHRKIMIITIARIAGHI